MRCIACTTWHLLFTVCFSVRYWSAYLHSHAANLRPPADEQSLRTKGRKLKSPKKKKIKDEELEDGDELTNPELSYTDESETKTPLKKRARKATGDDADGSANPELSLTDGSETKTPLKKKAKTPKKAPAKTPVKKTPAKGKGKAKAAVKQEEEETTEEEADMDLFSEEGEEVIPAKRTRTGGRKRADVKLEVDEETLAKVTEVQGIGPEKEDDAVVKISINADGRMAVDPQN